MMTERQSSLFPGFRRRRNGQMAIMMVLTSILFLLIMIPMIDLYVKNEAKWSVKEKKSTTAFHLAEAGIDRARWKLKESDEMWVMTSTGVIPGYNFDKVYSDVGGGTYAIKISSDATDVDKRIVESVGRDSSSNEMRKIRAVFINNAVVDFSARAENQATNTGGNEHVEWGPVFAGVSINATARTFPRFFSGAHVTPQDGGSTTPGTDNVYWWSYYEIPPTPKIKFELYLASAVASAAAGPAPTGCGYGKKDPGAYYIVGPATFENCTDTSNKTYYITGDVTFNSGSSNFIYGTIITLGSINISGSGGASGAYAARLPPEAWKEYGNNWAHYLAFDPVGTGTPATPATYAAALSTNYLATNKTYALTNVLIHGFIYTGGSSGLNGGGNCNINGSIMAGVNATMSTSGFCLYYDDLVASQIQLSGINIELFSWYEVHASWPTGLL